MNKTYLNSICGSNEKKVSLSDSPPLTPYPPSPPFRFEELLSVHDTNSLRGTIIAMLHAIMAKLLSQRAMLSFQSVMPSLHLGYIIITRRHVIITKCHAITTRSYIIITRRHIIITKCHFISTRS